MLKQRPRQTSRGSAGFSVVELVVVAGVIGLLIALLLGVVSTVRNRSLSTQCASSLRQVGVANSIFAHDHRGYLPLAGFVRVEVGLPTSDIASAVEDPNRKRYAYKRYLATTGLWEENLAPYWTVVAETLRQAGAGDLRCPAVEVDQLDEKPSVIVMSPSTRHAVFGAGANTYALNGNLLGFESRAGWREAKLRARIAGIRNASAVFLSIDADPNGTAAVNEGGMFLSRSMPKRRYLALNDFFELGSPVGRAFDRTRHRGLANVLFVDGHVDAVRIGTESLRRVVVLE